MKIRMIVVPMSMTSLTSLGAAKQPNHIDRAASWACKIPYRIYFVIATIWCCSTLFSDPEFLTLSTKWRAYTGIVDEKDNWQTVDTQIRRRRMRRLMRISSVCKKFNHCSPGISKSHSLTYLKSKLESSNIWYGRVYSVYNGLRGFDTHGRGL